jgi:hypothetical protein
MTDSNIASTPRIGLQRSSEDSYDSTAAKLHARDQQTKEWQIIPQNGHPPQEGAELRYKLCHPRKLSNNKN